MRVTRRAVGALSFAALITAGFGPSCTPQACDANVHCDGNKLVACPSFGFGNGEAGDCGARTCTVASFPTGGVYGVCAIGGKPDPQCAPASEDSESCDGDKIARCIGAYRESEVDCAAQGGVCESFRFNGRVVAGCVPTHQPDPICPPLGAAGPAAISTSLCDGSTRVSCFGPFRVLDYDCAADGRVCVNAHAASGLASFCALDASPDPRCVAGQNREFCDGDTAFACGGEFIRARVDCRGRGGRCVEHGGTVSCD